MRLLHNPIIGMIRNGDSFIYEKLGKIERPLIKMPPRKNGMQYDYYICKRCRSTCGSGYYFVGNDGSYNLPNNWAYKNGVTWDCVQFSGYTLYDYLSLGEEEIHFDYELTAFLDIYGIVANLVEKCKTISEALAWLKENNYEYLLAKDK